MRKIREVLRRKFEQRFSERQISAATGLSKGSVSAYLSRAAQAQLDWATAQDMTEAELEGLLFEHPACRAPELRAPIDYEWVHREMRRTGVTLQLLCVEYQHGVVQANDGRRP